MVWFLSCFLCFLFTTTIDYYIVNLPFIMLFIMDFFRPVECRELLIHRDNLVLLGFYYIPWVLVLWKCYRAQNIWFILCLIMFKLPTGIYMLLVDAALDGETSAVRDHLYVFRVLRFLLVLILSLRKLWGFLPYGFPEENYLCIRENLRSKMGLKRTKMYYKNQPITF